jgi:short-subunit dehydrogenase
VTHDDAPALRRQQIAATGGMDLYFHVSGIGKQNPQLEEDIESNTLKTNGLGFTRMIGEAYRYFAEKDSGHIAAISSIAGTKGMGAAPSYSATKAFQNTYLQSLEQQAHMRKLSIRFTDIRPGFVDTALLDNTHYPLMMKPEYVAKKALQAIDHKRHICVIDWRWRVITAFWRRIPRWIWRRLNIK